MPSKSSIRAQDSFTRDPVMAPPFLQRGSPNPGGGLQALCDLCPLDPNLGPSSYSRLLLLGCGHISHLAVMGLTRQSPHLRAFALTVISAPKANCTRARGYPSRPPGCIHTAPLLTLWSRPGTFCFPIFLLQHTVPSSKSSRQSLCPSSPVSSL